MGDQLIHASILNYATPQRRNFFARPERFLRIALACALLPAVAGTTVILAWLITFVHVLEYVGLVVFIAGGFLFFSGCVALLLFLIAAFKQPSWPRGKILVTALLIGLALVANFPLSFSYMWLGECYRVDIVNSTGTTIDSIIINDPNARQIKLGPIAPGGKIVKWFHPEGEGSLDMIATWKTGASNAIIAGYVTGSQAGEHKTITIQANGSSTVN